jgi:hypothetical protein
MKKIINYRPLLHRLSDVEHFDLFDSTILHVYSLLRPIPLLPSWEFFVQTFALEDKIYKQTTQYAEARLIRLSHRERRKAYMAFREWLDMKMEPPHGYTTKIQQAAQILWDAAEPYNGSYALPVDEFSTKMLGLIRDIEDEQYAEQMAITDSYIYISRLKRLNTAFMTLYDERTCSDDLQDEGLLAEARLHSDHAFAAFAEFVVWYYHTDEARRIEDPRIPNNRVDESLTDIIRFLDIFIRRYEGFYARRKMKRLLAEYQAAHPGEDLPAREIPQLAIASQEVLEESAAAPGYGVQMALHASDPAAFDDALFPGARKSVVRFRKPETEAFVDFPVADFLSAPGGRTLSGLLLDAPDLNTVFGKPFAGEGGVRAEVVKDDETLAILEGVQYPASMRTPD